MFNLYCDNERESKYNFDYDSKYGKSKRCFKEEIEKKEGSEYMEYKDHYCVKDHYCKEEHCKKDHYCKEEHCKKDHYCKKEHCNTCVPALYVTQSGALTSGISIGPVTFSNPTTNSDDIDLISGQIVLTKTGFYEINLTASDLITLTGITPEVISVYNGTTLLTSVTLPFGFNSTVSASNFVMIKVITPIILSVTVSTTAMSPAGIISMSVKRLSN